MNPASKPSTADKVLSTAGEIDSLLGGLRRVRAPLPSRINTDSQNVERGLVQLVLTLVELLRQLMERQAVRRMEGGTLSDAEIERLGQTFLQLQKRMAELRETFGLEESDLNLDLGPLGTLL